MGSEREKFNHVNHQKQTQIIYIYEIKVELEMRKIVGIKEHLCMNVCVRLIELTDIGIGQWAIISI